VLKLAIIFAVLSLIAGGLGFSGVAGASARVAKIIFAVFLILLGLALAAIVLGFSIAF